jgi:hypothetical protein
MVIFEYKANYKFFKMPIWYRGMWAVPVDVWKKWN